MWSRPKTGMVFRSLPWPKQWQPFHVDEPSQKNAKPAKTHEPTKRLGVDVLVSVHRRVKTACSAAHHQMFAERRHLIEARISVARK